MKNIKVAALFLALSLLFCISPKIYALSGGGEGSHRDGDISSSNWYSLSDDERFYTARRGAINNGLNWSMTIEQYHNNKQARDYIYTYGYYYTFDMSDPVIDAFYNTDYPGVGLMPPTPSPADQAVYSGIIDDGSEDFGKWSDYVGESVSDAKKDEFYSTVSHSNPTTMNLGNGYSIKVEMIVDVNTSPPNYNTYQTVYFNGNQISYDLKHTTSGFRGTANVYAYDFWVTKTDTSPYVYTMNFTYYFYDLLGAARDVTGAYQLDATLFDFVPSGGNPADIYPSYVGGNTSNTPFVPVDGSDQTSVNEQIQTQNNEIIEWLKKIYGEELNIKGVINNLFNPLNNLYSVMNNCYNVLYSIFGKLDNLTVKLKDWNGDEFKIELGDLELGDLNVDFDVVYNVTGISKITSPSDLTNKLPTYKSTLESKIGITNMKTSINNFTQALFGQSIFGQNGGVVSGTISESSSTPHWFITFMDNTYDIFAYLSLVDSSYIQFWKDVVSFFLLLGTGLTVFKYIPVLVGNVSGAYNTVNADVEPSHMNDVQYRTYLNQKYG